ncbi:22905_t:CDS:2, partial [Cetraspora pellucida]
NKGLQFIKYSQKNDQDGVDRKLDAFIVLVPPDPDSYQGPIYDFKYYFSKRPKDFNCKYLHLQINKKNVPLVITMSITGHKSESSYRIYAHPSNKQKEEMLSQLISSVGTLPSSNNQVATPLIKDKSSLTKPFCQLLSAKNLPLHINASKPVLTLGSCQLICRNSKLTQESKDQEFKVNNDASMIIKNYYINAGHITIN